jgi:predicted RNase H-like nuclease
MNSNTENIWLAGIDGCPNGWLAVFVHPKSGAMDDAIKITVFPRFSDIWRAAEKPAIIAIDIPVGLPAKAGTGGRAAENTVRPLLGPRQSSVFSVPARAAIYTADYQEACRLALMHSDPPRKVSKQLFNIAPKIREVDEALRADAALASRIFEVHPELAFWRLNGERPLSEPKKIKSRPYEPGLVQRRDLLIQAGLPKCAVKGEAPKGAYPDDLLDALACAATARRIHAKLARPFPDPPPRDDYGLPMAIWA